MEILSVDKFYNSDNFIPVALYDNVKNLYQISWEFEDKEGSGVAVALVKDAVQEDIKQMILSFYNNICQKEILTEFLYKKNQVWLSQENQFNYKAALDLAVQTGGENLPVTFKFGTDEEPVFQEFTSIPELQDFVSGMLRHINMTLKKYWDLKQEIDWSKYQINR